MFPHCTDRQGNELRAKQSGISSSCSNLQARPRAYLPPIPRLIPPRPEFARHCGREMIWVIFEVLCLALLSMEARGICLLFSSRPLSCITTDALFIRLMTPRPGVYCKEEEKEKAI